jgi:hypothetical protein
VKLWVNDEGSCVACCVASFIGVHPADLANDGSTQKDRDELDSWLRARFGRRLELVQGNSYADMPSGTWIALLHRRNGLSHAMLAKGSTLLHDPATANGGGPIWPDDLAYAHDRDLPLGWRVVNA